MTADFEEIARQLYCPQGDKAKEVGEKMFVFNRNMIEHSINCAQWCDQHSVLEVGFGSGLHIPTILQKAQGLHYTGVDISNQMLKEARQNNRLAVLQQQVELLGVNENEALPFADGAFDICLTMNTLYFAKQAQWFISDMCRVLKPNGQLLLTCITKDFLQNMPFTKSLFTLYEQSDIERLLQQAGLRHVTIKHFAEEVEVKPGKKAIRPFLVTVGIK